MSQQESYRSMWEDFGRAKSSYLGYKFTPTHRIGLTNFLREYFIWQYIEAQTEDTILDSGCAAGRQLFGIAKSIKAGYGVDIAQNFVDMAIEYKQKYGFDNLHFSQGGTEKMDFADGFFDKAICAEVLEHVFDKDVALNELVRVLRPGGKLIITVPNLNADATLWGRLLRALKIRKFVPIEVFSKDELAKHGDAHVREFSRASMRSWLSSRGLEVKRIQTISFIDGPKWFEFLLKAALHIKPLQKLIIGLEKMLTRSNMALGRHLIVEAIKK